MTLEELSLTEDEDSSADSLRPCSVPTESFELLDKLRMTEEDKSATLEEDGVTLDELGITEEDKDETLEETEVTLLLDFAVLLLHIFSTNAEDDKAALLDEVVSCFTLDEDTTCLALDEEIFCI